MLDRPPGLGSDYFRLNGAGEMLVYSAADFEDFRQPRPDMPPEMESELKAVVRVLVQNRWPDSCPAKNWRAQHRCPL
jgi:predicted amidohydrolase YtcJ